MAEKYEGEERRRKCVECISHREHTAKLDHLKSELIEIKADMKTNITAFKTEIRSDSKTMWESIKAKVPYIHFISGLTLIITAIGIVTGINWNTMTKVLDSNHRVELQMTALQSEFKTTSKRLLDVEFQLDIFRKRDLQITQELINMRQDHRYIYKTFQIPKEPEREQE